MANLHFMQVATMNTSAMTSAQGSVLKPAHVEVFPCLDLVNIVSDSYIQKKRIMVVDCLAVDEGAQSS